MSTQHSSSKDYLIGFVLSVLLTLLAFFVVWQKVFEDILLISSLIVLAITQLYVQVRFFFGLESEKKPQWNTMAFIFMLLVVVIVVFGSLWIMDNLDYNMMPDAVETYIIEEEGITP